MTNEVQYCRGPGVDGNPCGREVGGHGEEVCGTHRKQLQRTGKMVPIAEKVSPKEHLLNLVNRWAEAESDQEYETAERAVITAAKEMGRSTLAPEDVADLLRKARSDIARRRAAQAKARGSRIGRPPEADPERVNALLGAGLSTHHVALALGVSERTVRRCRTKSSLLTKPPQEAKSTTACSPRSERGS